MTLDDAKTSLNRYRDDRQPLGSFLNAVLENDLVGSYQRADPESRAIIYELLQYIWMELPASSWGSPRRVRAWLEGKSE